MEQYIAGVIKDISFHELFMKLLRGENIRNTLFDIQLAYYMLDSSGDTIVSASEIRGFMHKHSYSQEEYVWELVVMSRDKSLVGLTFENFARIVIEGSEEEILLACHRNTKPKLSSTDYEFWDRVKGETLLKTLNILGKEAQFYSELEERKVTFCKNWSGDVYKALGFFNQKDCLSYEDVRLFLKGRGVLFNEDQWRALVSRTTCCNVDQYPKTIKKQELIDCLVTSKFKKNKTQEQRNKEKSQPCSYTKWLDEQYVLERRHQLKSPKIDLVPQPPQITQLFHRYHYPEAQIHSRSNLYLLEQKSKYQVIDRLKKLDRQIPLPPEYPLRKQYNPGVYARNPFALNKY